MTRCTAPLATAALELVAGLALSWAPSRRESRSKWRHAEFVERAVEKLKPLRAAGVSTIVDLTTYDVWRDIRFLEEVARKSGLNMIACTGERFFPPIAHVSMPARTIEGLADFFQREIEQGIDGTGIKAGVIKIGVVAQERDRP